VAIPFYAFRIMVVVGFAMLFLIIWALWKWWKKGLQAAAVPQRGLFWRLWTWALPLGLIATYMGWAVREVGRQPWIIYQLMLTKDGVSPVSAGAAAGSLALFAVIYISLMALFIYFARRIIIKGPDMSSTAGPDSQYSRSYRG
jgi:cytochrome d ubiquinol oxidase subunit I